MRIRRVKIISTGVDRDKWKSMTGTIMHPKFLGWSLLNEKQTQKDGI